MPKRKDYNKVKNYDYYKARIDNGYYPSARIFKQSLGRSLLHPQEKGKLVSYAEKILVNSTPGRSRKLRPVETVFVPAPVEVPSLTPQILKMIEEAPAPDKGPERRLKRLNSVTSLLTSPLRQLFLELIEDAAEDHLELQELHDIVQTMARLLDFYRS